MGKTLEGRLPVGLAVGLGLVAAALAPTLDRAAARRAREQTLGRVEVRLEGRRTAGGLATLALPLAAPRASLASWSRIAGCGAAGGSASGPGGGIKWIGRNVTGGVLDAQVLSSQTYAQGNQLTSLSTRLAVSPRPRLGLALNVPILYKAGEVAVLGLSKPARIAGFGDLSLEASYRLGAIASHQLMVTLSAPTGSADAVRQGVVLPQHLQLGSGVPGAVAQYEHTRDQDWGLVVVGGTLGYGGWENDIGDYRAPSATAYAHVGYLLHRWVPSAGLTLFGKPWHDRERGADRPADRDPLVMLVPSVGLEWSNDWLALMPAATVGLSSNGVESVSLGLGVSSSLF
jgi:hypothetical protein